MSLGSCSRPPEKLKARTAATSTRPTKVATTVFFILPPNAPDHRPRARDGDLQLRRHRGFGASGLFGDSVIVFQSLSHAHDIVHRIPQPPVKLDDTVIRSPHLQIDLRATSLP